MGEVQLGIFIINIFVVCFNTGVDIIDTSLIINTGNPLIERSNRHSLVFNLELEPAPTSGAAIGTSLWRVELFASSGISTSRVSPTVNVLLTSSQSGTSLQPPAD